MPLLLFIQWPNVPVLFLFPVLHHRNVKSLIAVSCTKPNPILFTCLQKKKKSPWVLFFAPYIHPARGSKIHFWLTISPVAYLSPVQPCLFLLWRSIITASVTHWLIEVIIPGKGHLAKVQQIQITCWLRNCPAHNAFCAFNCVPSSLSILNYP